MTKLSQQFVVSLPPAVDFFADLVTVTLGLVALWGLILKRKELSLAFRMFTNIDRSHRVHRLKETLWHLNSLSYDNKEHRTEIRALLGQVCGQVRSLADNDPKLKALHAELAELTDGRKGLSESKKRRIVFEIHGCLDSASFDQTASVIGTK